MPSAFASAFKTPELRKKIFFTLGILLVFRFGSTIPAPNVNIQALNICLNKAAGGQQAGLYSLINLFSGGALLYLAIFILGVILYITSPIIPQLLAVTIPWLEALRKEGAAGQAKITQYTWYLTPALALLQATASATMACTDQLLSDCKGIGILHEKVEFFPLVTMTLTMIAGTVMIMWLGGLITDCGVGNGMSVLILIQIAAQFPTGLWPIKEGHQGATGWFLFLAIVTIGLLAILGILLMEQGQQRVPVQYARRMVRRKLVDGSTTYVPLKINQPGVISVIFVSPILYLPTLYATSRPQSGTGQWITTNFHTNSWVYSTLQFPLIVDSRYFYATITFNSEEASGSMKKHGGFTLGIRAGKPTERYLTYVLNRLTAPGPLYLTIISVIPTLALITVDASQNFPFGGISILIIVGVVLGTVKRIESQLQQRNYEGFLR